MKSFQLFLFLLTSLLISPTCLAQYEELGQFPTRHYAPEEYGGNPFVFGTALDSSGQLFLANYAAPSLVKYDGVQWEEVDIDNRIAWEVAKGADDKIYISSTDDLGYLEVDSLGTYYFESLKSLASVQDSSLDLGQMRQVIAQGTFLYFRSANTVIRYDTRNKTLKIWTPEEGHYFIKILVAADRLFVFGDKKGAEYYDLYELKDNELVPIQHDFLTQNIVSILPSPNDQLLFATAKKGLYEFDGQVFKSFATEADELIMQNLRSAALLSNGRYVLMTNDKGGCILDRTGKIITYLDAEHNLTSNNFLSLHYEESNYTLWINTYDQGTFQIDVSEHFTLFDQNTKGEDFYFSDLARYRDDLYSINATGIALNQLDRVQRNFRPLSLDNGGGGISMDCTERICLFNIGSLLYEMNEQGVAELPKVSDFTIKNVSASTQDAALFFISTSNGFYWMQQSEGRWRSSGQFLLEEYDIINVVALQANELWVSTSEGSYFSLNFRDGIGSSDPIIKEYPPSENFVGSVELRILGGQLVAGHYYYNRTSDQFELDERFPKLYDFDELNWLLTSNEVDGKIWTLINLDSGKNLLGVYSLQSDGKYHWDAVPLQQIFTDQLAYTQKIYAEENGVVWLAGRQVIRVDTRKVPPLPTFKAQVTKVQLNSDSTIFAGQGTPNFSDIDYQNNNIRFAFAATNFPLYGTHQYQSQLEGFDRTWSKWEEKTERNYTNLPEGEYVFQVRAKAPNGQISQIGSYTFEVLPPWYLTAWSFLLYGLLMATAIFLLYKWIERRIQKQSQQKMALQEATQIQKLNQLKSRFYTNITHEFRTPLTVILGMNQEKDNPKAQTLIDRNGKKLLHLINQLLDLSKLDADGLPTNYQQIEIVSFTQYIGESFQSLADRKYIRLTIYSEIEELHLDMDEEKYRQIISNLLSNAIKFTRESGKIILHLAEKEELLFVKITDNGVGIEPKELPHIFDRFYQIENTQSKQGEGTGIGLALVKELVQLLGGSIRAESKINAGTTFHMQFPIRRTSPRRLATYETIDTDNSAADGIDLLSAKGDTDLPRLLIIEDNTDVVIYIQSLLSTQYDLILASNGEEGIYKAIEHTPDIIISDVMMPKKNGFEVVETLKQDIRTSHIPIILLTAKATQEDKVEGLKHGADAYLMKPFNKEELFIRLKNLIAIRQQLQQKYQNYRASDTLKASDSSTVISIEEKFLLEVQRQIEANYTKADFDVEFLANSLHISRMQLFRKLKAVTDQTPTQLIRDVRLEKAKILLKDKQLNISEIAYELGYNDPNYFIRQFRKAFHQSPNAY
ncbi:MAG: ATP-binding protein, partial [Bacteroidota bacterium]